MKDATDDINIEKRISQRQKLREYILEELNKRLKEDGLFDEINTASQEKNTTIYIMGDIKDGNIIVGNNNNLDT